jgi:hypothetical protein
MPNWRVFKHVVIALAALGGALGVHAASAQPYPARDITFIVAFAPGGVADTLARFVGKGLGERLGRTVVVENRGGAGGNIAAAAVARAAPDGYTLLVTTTAVAINETLRPNKGFAASDLKPIAIVASSPEALVTSPDNPAANLADFLKTAQGKNIAFGSAGVGSGSHIAAEYFFKEIAKISATHVPFQGGAPAIAATIGNQIDLLATTLGRRRGGADRQRQAQRSGRRQRQARRRYAERADLRGGGLSLRSFVLGRRVRSRRHQPGDRHYTERDDRRSDEGPGAAAEAHLHRLRSDRRIAGGDLLQGRGGEVGQDGQDAGAIDQLRRVRDTAAD